MIHIIGETDDTLVEKVQRIISGLGKDPRIVINMEFVTSWHEQIGFDVLEIWLFCEENGVEFVLANIEEKLRGVIRSSYDMDLKFPVKLFNSLQTAGNYLDSL